MDERGGESIEDDSKVLSLVNWGNIVQLTEQGIEGGAHLRKYVKFNFGQVKFEMFQVPEYPAKNTP